MSKRSIQRVWGHRHKGGYVYRRDDLIKALKMGDVVEFQGLQFGTKPLQSLINLLPYEECLIRTNGSLEVETIAKRWMPNGKVKRCQFFKPSHDYHFLKIVRGAWLPKTPKLTAMVVVIRPQRF